MSNDDELPDLATLLAPSISSTVARRQSPRKGKPARQIADDRFSYEASASVQQMRGSPRKPAQKKTSPIKVESRKPSSISLGYVPVLSRNSSTAEVAASSSNSLARSPQQRSIGLTHVDSLLLPLSKVCLDGISRQPSLTRGLAGPKSEATRMSRSLKAFKSSKHLNVSTKASQFVLYEAACADVSDDSRVDDEGDEDTDLSGFVVDDDADLSVHDSSSDSEYDKKAKRKPSASPRRRRIQQGSRPNEPVEVISLDSDSDKENKHEQILSSAFQDMSLGLHGHQSRKQDAEVVDLTSSPVRTQRPLDRQDGNTEGLFDQYTAPREPGQPVNLFEDFDAILRLSPPRSSDPSILQTKVKSKPTDLSDVDVEDRSTDNMPVKGNFRTPPTTPPRSPSKLKSPSKLLSPSKRAAQIPNSPHRQSIDGFWDLEVVNTWHDTYSPKKEPLASPKKNRFQQWLDSDDEDDGALSALVNDSSDSPPSPCSSPKKPRSPLKSPEKAEKQRFLEEKRAAKAKKQEFNSKKEQIATTLLHDLDTNIASSKLTTLSSSTGGVQIIWSKTLRSTAGRANWRRTLIKPSGSPVKGPAVPSDSKVQHYASIELAAKVIDCESRLVNTLAHEFCHLANFMVSGVRDQPHGASFKAWAAKVTTYLRSHDNLMYRGVEVTTKHNYAIEFKYLWVCTGREMLEMLKSVPEMENGCGAEYGRHSKSIDTEKSRCGRCKGVLVQVRPKPRKVDPERRSPRKALFQKKSNVETMTGAVEFVDLSD